MSAPRLTLVLLTFAAVLVLSVLPYNSQARAADNPAVSDPFHYQEIIAPSDKVAAAVVTSGVYPESRWTKLKYAYNDSEPVPALLVEPIASSAAHPAPCLLLVHGAGGQKEQMLPIARLLAQDGYASLMIDLPGYGARAPKTPIQFTTQTQLDDFVVGLLTQSVDDLGAGIQYLTSLPEIDHARLGLIGISLGSIIGADLAGVDPRIRAVMLVAGGGGLGDILTFQAKTHVSFGVQYANLVLGQTPARLNRIFAPVDPLTYVHNIAPRPLIMENGAADPIIPPSAAQALYDAAAQPKHMDRYAGEGHIPSPTGIFAAFTTFLMQNLPVPAK